MQQVFCAGLQPESPHENPRRRYARDRIPSHDEPPARVEHALTIFRFYLSQRTKRTRRKSRWMVRSCGAMAKRWVRWRATKSQMMVVPASTLGIAGDTRNRNRRSRGAVSAGRFAHVTAHVQFCCSRTNNHKMCLLFSRLRREAFLLRFTSFNLLCTYTPRRRTCVSTE